MQTVLLVDDDIDVRFAMSQVLKRLGYDILEAANGIEALERLRERSVDHILLDIFMPEKDGFETINDVRRLYPDIKIIAMSGYNESSFSPLESAKSLGANSVLAKPFSAHQLQDALS
ncbi:response regulator [Terasakiella sp. SH-1]|uniref:response regulator n=1 Tax=Terasakiella sp. SH-1 TaxID=2560057 RepID=UPI0010731FA7|nr:response regulator [Terasakiella sp. SH-1]